MKKEKMIKLSLYVCKINLLLLLLLLYYNYGVDYLNCNFSIRF